MIIKPEVLEVLSSWKVLEIDHEPEGWPNVRMRELTAVRTELTRLSEIADMVEPLVVRLGEVTSRLGRAHALLRECLRLSAHFFRTPTPDDLYEQIEAHLSEPRT